MRPCARVRGIGREQEVCEPALHLYLPEHERVRLAIELTAAVQSAGDAIRCRRCERRLRLNARRAQAIAFSDLLEELGRLVPQAYTNELSAWRVSDVRPCTVGGLG